MFLRFSIFFVAATSEGGAGGRHIPDQWDSVAVAALVLYINVPALLVYSNVAALVLSSNPTVVNSAGLYSNPIPIQQAASISARHVLSMLF